jgi:hypothetical protein
VSKLVFDHSSSVLTLLLVINKTHTHLDTEDFSLWTEAGLLIDEQGSLISNKTFDNGFSDDSESMMKEDLICNALIWLMAKLVNFIAASANVQQEMDTMWTGTSQATLFDYWCQLQVQFQTWHDGLPITFQPSARVAPKGGNETMFSEIWYNIPMCASTMQTYHMGRILLSMNKPHESTQHSTVCARLNSYQSVLDACQKHSREIVGISLARSEDAVRIFSVQPLFTAGQCLSDVRERQVVLGLLRDVESDIGHATDYRVRQLVEQWQWEQQQDVFVP